jgi:hypothetical protein
VSDRGNRRVLGVIGLLLLIGGGLSVCLGAGAFGTARSNRNVFDTTVIRWWNEGGWMSFAVVVAIGVVAAVIGLVLALSQLRRDDRRPRTPDMTLPPPEGARGETTLRAQALSHSMASDLERIPDVHGAKVGLFGAYPEIELRAVLEVGDHADMDQLPQTVNEVLDRFQTTTGVRPDPVQIMVRFKHADRERVLR